MSYIAEEGKQTHKVEVPKSSGPVTVVVDGEAYSVDLQPIGGSSFSLLLNGRSYTVDTTSDGEKVFVSIGGDSFRFRVVDERRQRLSGRSGKKEQQGRSEIRAMMPGKVVDVLVEVDADVQADQAVLIIEAMKMENEIKTPAAGKVKAVHVKPGQTVKTGDLLALIE